MVGEGTGLREEIFKRGLVADLEVVGRAEAGVEIILKIGAEVDLVEGVFLFAEGIGGDVFGGALHLGLAAGDVVEQGNGLVEFLKNGVFDDFGVDHLLQLELVQGQDTDHLHEARGQNLPLRDFQAQFWLKKCHRCLKMPLGISISVHLSAHREEWSFRCSRSPKAVFMYFRPFWRRFAMFMAWNAVPETEWSAEKTLEPGNPRAAG